MENRKLKNYYMVDATAIAIAFIGILFSAAMAVDKIYLTIGLSGGLFLVRYIYCVYDDKIRVKQGLLVLMIAIYIIVSWIDPSYFMLFTIYFITTSIENSRGLSGIKNILVIILPEGLLLFKFIVNSEPYQLIELIVLELIFLFIGLIFIMVEKVSNEYANTNDRMNEALARAAINELNGKRMNKELALKNVLADRNARLEEREKISMDIHNSVGHTITAAIMALDAAEVIYDTQQLAAKDKIIVANVRMHESLNSIRQAVRVLSNKEVVTSIEDLFHSLMEGMRRFEADTQVKIRDNLNRMDLVMIKKYIDAECGNFLYGALKECLTNGVKHGGATAFIVMAEADDRQIRVVIQDNGKGLGPLTMSEKNKIIKSGFGLRKMKKYIENAGGDFNYKGEEGFIVSITLPLVEEKYDTAQN